MKKILVLFLCFAIATSACFAKKQKAAKERAEADKAEKELKSKGWSVVPVSEENGFSKKIVIAKNGKNVSVEKGIVRIQTFSENGSVAFYVLGKSGEWRPVVETNDHAESTYVSLFVDRTEYRLNRSKKVEYVYEIEEDCVSVIYKINSVAQLKAKYRIEGYSIYVSYSVLNLDIKPHSFAVKTVFNTILGENYEAHFTTPSQDVSAEISIVPSSSQNYIFSSDEIRTIRFAVFGDGITPPKTALLANKDVAEESNFASAFKNGRSFSSLLSYNNSSVAFFWDDENLGKKSGGLRYRIDFSNMELDARNYEKFPPYAPPEIEEPQIPDGAQILPPNDMQADAEEIPLDNDDVISDQDFNTERNYIDPSSIDDTYVQRLIDQINSLETADPDLNRDKIRELQDEMDRVLEILRSRK
ncbi:MAG: hypothetical protein HDR37_10425 [Treponema sp.]|nr:hypothetical protein [Treponema sp.]